MEGCDNRESLVKIVVCFGQMIGSKANSGRSFVAPSVGGDLHGEHFAASADIPLPPKPVQESM